LHPLVPPKQVLSCNTQPVSTLPHFQVQFPVHGGGGGGETHGVVVSVGSQIVGVPVGVEHGQDARHGLYVRTHPYTGYAFHSQFPVHPVGGSVVVVVLHCGGVP